MKHFLTTLAVASLGVSSVGTLATINNHAIDDVTIQKQIALIFNNKERLTKTFYQPNQPGVSFFYIDITNKKPITNNNINITLKNINYTNQQTEIHSKQFDSLTISSTLFESATVGNPSDWDAEIFHQSATILYSSTINEGVTRYTGDLAVAVTRDITTGKTFFVWGVYGEVVIGSNRGMISAEATHVIIEF